MKNKNLGFSLVELIVAFAIAAIAGLAAFQMMSFGNNSFKNTSNDVGLQYEQQIVVNQLRDYILESSNAIHYDALHDSLYVFKQDGKMATESGDTIDVPYEISKIKFIDPNLGKSEGDEGYDANNVGKLYVNSKSFKTIPDNYVEELQEDGEVFGKDVKSVSFDLSELEKGKVSFDITFFSEGKEYKSHQVVSLRNAIIDSDSLLEIYEERNEILSFMEGIDIYRDDMKIGAVDTVKRPANVSDPNNFVLGAYYEARVSKNEYSEFDYTGGIKWELDSSSLSEAMQANVALVEGLDKDKVKLTIKGDVVGSVKLTAVSEFDSTIKKTITINIESTGGVYPVRASLPDSDPVKKVGTGTVEYLFNPKIEYNTFVEHLDGTSNTETREGNEAYPYIEWHLVDEEVGTVKVNYEDGTVGEAPLYSSELLSDITGDAYNATTPIKDGKIAFSSLANGYTFKFYFTVKQRSAEGEEVRSNTITVKVEVPDVSNSPFKLAVNEVSMRDDFITPSILWKVNPDTNNVKYYWKIVPTKTDTSVEWYNDLNRITSNFEQRVTIYTKDKHIKNQGVEPYAFGGNNLDGKITIGNINTGSSYNVANTSNWYVGDVATYGPVAYVDSYLDWDHEYAIKVLCFAVTYDKDGNPKTLYDQTGATNISNITTSVEVTPVEENTTIRKVELRLNPINYISQQLDMVTLKHPGDNYVGVTSEQKGEKYANVRFNSTENRPVFVQYRSREYETEVVDGKTVYKLDSAGRKIPKKDSSGNIIYIDNEFGEPKYEKDANDKPVYEHKDGYPVYENIAGSPKYKDELNNVVDEGDIKTENKNMPVEYSTDMILKADARYKEDDRDKHDVEIRLFRLTAQGLHLSFNDTQSVIKDIDFGKHTLISDPLNRTVKFTYDLRQASNENKIVEADEINDNILKTLGGDDLTYYNRHGIVGFAFWIIPNRSPFVNKFVSSMDYQMTLKQSLIINGDNGSKTTIPFTANTDKLTYTFDLDYIQK